ncbi:MAG: hypothetical protein FVQ80_10865 [Planctomycetes bacterium]|nr:hypothetical protein [Planctomycetota bacterium]
MEKPRMPHSGHNQHLCYLVNLGFQQRRPAEYRSLIKEPKFICKKCGRAAAKAKNLCNPAKL